MGWGSGGWGLVVPGWLIYRTGQAAFGVREGGKNIVRRLYKGRPEGLWIYIPPTHLQQKEMQQFEICSMLSRSESFLWPCRAWGKRVILFKGSFQTPQSNKMHSCVFLT